MQVSKLSRGSATVGAARRARLDVALRGAQIGAALLLLALAALAGFNPRAALSYAYGHRQACNGAAEFEYAVLDPRTDSQVSSSDRSWRSLEDLGRRYSRPVFWFALDGKSYVVSDPRWVERTQAIVAPMEELGRRIGEAAKQPGRSARRSEELGRRQQEASDRASRRLERLARDAFVARKAGAWE